MSIPNIAPVFITHNLHTDFSKILLHVSYEYLQNLALHPPYFLYVRDSQFVTSDFFTFKTLCRDVQRYAGDSEVNKRFFKTSRVLLPNRDAKICSLIIVIKEK